MAPRSKIVDETEVEHWIAEGRTYAWMAEEYLRKYNLEISPTTFSNLRARKGLPRRFARDVSLIPWEIKPEHRFAAPLWALRAEGRRRSGMEMKASTLERLAAWKDRQFADDRAIHYDPDTEQGWWLLLHRGVVDQDIIREPGRVTVKRLPRD